MHAPTLLSAPAAARPRRAAVWADLPLWVVVGTITAAFVRFGYHYGSGDQDELFPSLLHLLDGDLFIRDWIVQTVTGGLNVRTYFVWLTALPSFLMPPWLAVLLLWLMVSVGLCYALFALARELGAERLGAALGVFLAVAVTVRWTVGGNAIAYDALLPEGVGWALAVPAVVAFLRGRMVWAGAMLGVAAWFHLLAGLHPALVLGGAALLAGIRTPGTTAVALARFTGAFLLVGLPILVPVAWDHLLAVRADPMSVSPFYIHAYFRNPHHHLYLPPDWGRWLRFGVVLAAGLGSAWWLMGRGALRHSRLLVASGVVVVLLLVLGTIGVHVLQSSVLMKLQFQKLTVLVVVVATIMLASAIGHALPLRAQRWGKRCLDHRRLGLFASLGLAALVLALAEADAGRPGAMLYPVRHAESPLGEAEAWARRSTPVNALFAIPPNVDTFRSNARRAVVANFDAFVFTDAAMQDWFERLMAVAPIDPPRTAAGVRETLDSAYHGQDVERWMDLAERFGIDYVLRRRDTAPLPFPVAFENVEWRVYAIPGETIGT
jgi:hypothetical protein